MRRVLTAALFVAVVQITARPVLAAGVVGTGTRRSCTEAAFDGALAGGGAVTFNCGPAATIILTHTKTITTDTHIAGGGLITLSGGAHVRLFVIESGVSLSLDSLALVDGWSGTEPGGGIRNLGTLTINNCTLSGHISENYGGAVDNEGACTVHDSTFYDNNGGIGGGGIANFRTLNVRSSTFLFNLAGIPSFYVENKPGRGGGIANFGSLTVVNTTFASNTAVSRNAAFDPVPGLGGGLFNAGTASVTNNTFSRNGVPGKGVCGGVYSTGPLTAKNTIVANSVGTNCCAAGPPDHVAPELVTPDSTRNLVDDQYSYCGDSFMRVTQAALRLGGLLGNGGPTTTIELLPGSVAIAAGDPTTCRDAATMDGVDQRGLQRFGPGDLSCDIGAFETPFSSVPAPTPAPSFLALDGQSDEYITRGRHVFLTTADGRFDTTHSFGSVTINFTGNAAGVFWRLHFVAPLGMDLVPGDFGGASRHEFSDVSEPGLDVSGGGRGCNRVTGRFSVGEALYALDGSVDTFAADFEQHCEGAPPALFGRIRLKSNAPTASPRAGTPTATPTSTPASALTRTPTHVAPRCNGDCSSDGTITVNELVTGVGIALGHAPLATCVSFDTNGDGDIIIDELVAAVAGALEGCSP